MILRDLSDPDCGDCPQRAYDLALDILAAIVGETEAMAETRRNVSLIEPRDARSDDRIVAATWEEV